MSDLELVAAAPVYFDENLLKSRGVSEALAKHFARPARFSPGIHLVDITLNGRMIGRVTTTFGPQGRLCATSEWLQALGLIARDEPARELCPAVEEAVSPRAVLRLSAASQTADLTVPEEVLAVGMRPLGFTAGGRATVLNYDFYRLATKFAGTSGSDFDAAYGDVTVGVNWDDWIIRARNRYAATDGRGAWSSMGWGQKTFEQYRQILQAGQIVSRDPLSGGVPLIGAQWSPESALRFVASSYPIKGNAATRARVEIRQDGVLIYDSVVPPGPFSITEYGAASGSGDLQVKVIEETGSESVFLVPRSALALYNTAAASGGLWLAAGVFDGAGATGNVYSRDLLVSGAYGFQLGDVAILGGAAVSSTFGTIGASLSNGDPATGVAWAASAQLSSDADAHREGGTLGISVFKTVSDQAAASFAFNGRTRGYRRVSEAMSLVSPALWGNSVPKWQFSAAGNYTDAWLGSWSVGYTRQQYFDGEAGNAFNIGWTYQLPWSANFSISAVRNLDRIYYGASSPGVRESEMLIPGGASVYVALSMPLGTKASTTSYGQRYSDTTRTGIRAQYAPADWISGTVGYEEAESSSSSYISANALARYVSVASGFAHSSVYDSAHVRLSGSVVATGERFASSPYPVQESFGLIDTGDLGGIRISSPAGPVWSGANGVALVPNLPAFQRATLEVDGRSLGADVELGVGKFEVSASRGAVVVLDTHAERVRRVLVRLSTPAGDPIAAGLAILDEDGNYVSATGKDGYALVTSRSANQKFFVELAGGLRCAISDIDMVSRSEGSSIDTGSALCI